MVNLPVAIPWQHPASYSGLHLYPIRLRLEKIQKNHLQVFESLRAQGIGVNLHYIPVYAQPYYARMGFKPEEFPQAEAYYGDAISLPMYQTLPDAQQDDVIAALSQALTA